MLPVTNPNKNPIIAKTTPPLIAAVVACGTKKSS